MSSGARHALRLVITCFLLVCATSHARQREVPYSWLHPQALSNADVPRVVLAPVDPARLLAEDSAAIANAAAMAGAPDKRLRVAVGNPVDITTTRNGIWQTQTDASRLWRLTIHADNATDLRFGFRTFNVPRGVTLHVISDSRHAYDGPYTDADASADHQLWLAPIAGDTLMLELHVPAGTSLDGDAVHLTTIATGYRNTTETGGPGLFGGGPSGTCNIDVICPLGDPYRNEIRAVAKYYFQEGASTFLCSGSLVNNTAQDLTPYFMTANHCISTQASATTMSLIWNYESPSCGQHGGGSTADTQNGGATLIAHRTDVDFSLVQLNSTPPANYHVYYAGWDASGNVPGGSIGIHHPSGWVKAITDNPNTLVTINSCIGTGGSQTHWRTGPYSQGTTEGGSSGSAIFVPSGDATGHENLITGTLSGGSALCTVPQGTDCYGKTAVAWNGTTAAQRLKDWLDPGNTGATTLPGIDPAGGGTDTIFEDGFDGSGGGFTQPLQDPSFEQTTADGGSNPFWSGSDTSDPGGTPFYSDGAGIPVFDGSFEVWFGGWNNGTPETQVFAQTVTIASGGPRYLNYWRMIDVAPEGSATLSITLDGTEIDNVDLDALGTDASFVQQSIDISAYGNNAAHAVAFRFDHNGTGTDGNTFIDLVTIDATPASGAVQQVRATHDPTLSKQR